MKVLTGIVLLLVSVSAFGQSNDTIDALLEDTWAEYNKTVYLVFTAAGLVPEDLPPQVAVAALQQQGMWYSPEKSGNPISFGDFSYILMESFQLPKGIMYSIFPSPWYAAREINFKRLLTEQKSLWDRMTPFEVIQAVGLALELQEANQ